MTRAAGLKSKAAEAFRRRPRAKLDVWVLARGSETKEKGGRADPPGQALELRAPVGVGNEEIEAAWALLARTSSATGSASASTARVSSVERCSSRMSSEASAKSKLTAYTNQLMCWGPILVSAFTQFLFLSHRIIL